MKNRELQSPTTHNLLNYASKIKMLLNNKENKSEGEEEQPLGVKETGRQTVAKQNTDNMAGK